MRCPFLREAQVKYCQGSAIKKMIVRMHSDTLEERCSSSKYVNCPSLKQYHEENSQQSRCPFLQESLMQYCSASSVTKYVPYSESTIIRCGNDGYRYCDLFLSVAATNEDGTLDDNVQKTIVDGIQLPTGLAYTSNHMWLDLSANGMCHIGVDGFLTRVFPGVDAISFLPSSNSHLQTVVLTVHDVDLHLAFPFPVNVTRVNSYLRVDVQKLVSRPYGAGWLYEGSLVDVNSFESAFALSNVFRGADAIQWMRSEVHHLSEFIHNRIIPSQFTGQPVMMDGGVVQSDFFKHLTKQELLQIFNEFFSPYFNRRKTV
jgi:glycine cleavage system H lipoate-binding protein